MKVHWQDARALGLFECIDSCVMFDIGERFWIDSTDDELSEVLDLNFTSLGYVSPDILRTKFAPVGLGRNR